MNILEETAMRRALDLALDKPGSDETEIVRSAVRFSRMLVDELARDEAEHEEKRLGEARAALKTPREALERKAKEAKERRARTPCNCTAGGNVAHRAHPFVEGVCRTPTKRKESFVDAGDKPACGGNRCTSTGDKEHHDAASCPRFQPNKDKPADAETGKRLARDSP